MAKATTSGTDALDLRRISLEWENETGYDSIKTIERVYGRSDSGAYKCCWPKCGVARKDAVQLWRHVHSGHGENTLPPIVQAADRAAKASS